MDTFSHTINEEKSYHDLLKRTLDAPLRPNRTDVATRGLFHEVLKFNLFRDGKKIMPLMTTKRVAWKAIYHELIWFLRGSTDVKYLQDNSITIWDGNSSREFLDKYSLGEYDDGEVGPIYGYQWRNWGATYINKQMSQELNISGSFPKQGIDQIATVIETLKNNPWDRRMIVSAWNVKQLNEMALPPCHYSFQFHVGAVDEKPTYLNCLVNMRSADIFLGVPFNIASYALLTHIIAHITGLTPGVLSISMADCHLYVNHEEQARIMIDRTPRGFPEFEFSSSITKKSTIDDFTNNYSIDDYIIHNYKPYPAIKATMAI